MTKKRKLLIALILAISGFYGNLYAQQSIYVKETNGTLTQISLTQVHKISFSGTNMVLQKNNANTVTWAISDIQKYYYDLTTKVDNSRISENPDLLIYPNPSNGNFNINYQVKQSSNVNIYIVSMDGKTIINLLSGIKEKGEHTIRFTHNLDTGSYFVKIEINNNITTKKLIILK